MRQADDSTKLKSKPNLNYSDIPEEIDRTWTERRRTPVTAYGQSENKVHMDWLAALPCNCRRVNLTM
jgi:hypothetical protein